MIRNACKNRYIWTVIFALSIASYVLGLFTSDDTGLHMLARIAAFGVSALCYLICMIYAQGPSLKKQLIVTNLAVFVHHLLTLIALAKIIFTFMHYSAIFQLVVWTAVPILVIIYGYVSDRTTYEDLFRIISDEKYLLIGTALIAFVVIAFSYGPHGPVFCWDINLAYNHVLRELDVMSLLEPREMVYCQHVSFVYFYIVVLFSSLLKSVELGFFACNAIFATIASFGFALLFRSMFPKRRISLILLATAACMLSPYIWGLTSLYLYDYACICAAPIILWAAYDRKWVIFTVLGFLAGFIKEPGILYYASVCAVVVLWELLSEKKKLSAVVTDVKYWFAVVSGVVFSILYLSMGNHGSYSGETFGYSEAHALATPKLFCIFHFSWIPTLMSVACIIYGLFIFSGRKKVRRGILLVSVPTLFYLVINCFMTTLSNPKYIDFFYPGILIMAVMFIMFVFPKDVVTSVVLTGLAIIFGFSNYYSYDPVSKLMFPQADIGETTMYCPNEISANGWPSDYIVYNRQFYGYDIAMSEAVSKGIEGGDEIIAIDNGDRGDNWCLSSGRWYYMPNEGRYDFDEYWDGEKNLIAPGVSPLYDDDERYIHLTVKYIFHTQDPVEELSKGDSFVYVYLPALSNGHEDAVRSAFDVVDEGSCTFRGWTVNYIRGKRQGSISR